MSKSISPAFPAFPEWAAQYDVKDPDPGLALLLDQTLPFEPSAKAAMITDQRRRSRQLLLPILRPLARAGIVAAQLVHAVTPKWPHAPRFLHRSIAFGMKRFLSPEANYLILRHFHVGAQVTRFIADNAVPGFQFQLEPMEPRIPEDVKDNLFLKHDLNIFNFVIQLNQELHRRGDDIGKCDSLNFSAIQPDKIQLGDMPRGRLNRIDLQTAIELYTPAYAFWLSDKDFWRASNSLQLDETIALYVARMTGEERHLSLVNNSHPLIPHSTLRAGYRLMLHGLATEVLYGFLLEMKLEGFCQANRNLSPIAKTSPSPTDLRP